MTPEQIVAVVTLMLAANDAGTSFPVIAKGGANPEYPLRIEACPRPLPPLEVEGKTVICGRVRVPENHDKANGKNIELAFAVLKSRSLSPAPDPVIYLHGGPGGGAVSDLASIVVPLWDSYRDRRDVVTFDQRAAGISSDMVTCFGTLQNRIVDIVNPANQSDAAQVKLLSECTKELQDSGRDLPSYNTTQNAKDVRALMQALGYASYNIYGVSYGTMLGLEVMRTAPEGVRAVVLDSVAPPQMRDYDTNIIPVQEGVQAVVDQCNADDACAKAFPKLDETINRVAEKLRLNPIPAARGRAEVNTKTLIQLFENRNAISNWPNATGHIPLILTEWDRGETKTWDLLSSGMATRAPTVSERLQPYLKTLTPEQQAMATVLLQNASATQLTNQATAFQLQALSDSLARSAVGATDLARRFDEVITKSVINTRSREAMLRFLSDYASLATKSPDRETLRVLVVDHLPPTDSENALALLAQLSEADVKSVFSAVSKEARSIYKGLVGIYDLVVIACQESVPFNSMEGMAKVLEGLKYPFLKNSDYADGTTLQLCKFIPPALSSPSFHEPVRSPLPALVLYGLNDTQTSSESARSTAALLGNAQAVGFPEAGHAALVFSQCAKDIGRAFIDNPAGALDTACTASLKPKWVLPSK